MLWKSGTKKENRVLIPLSNAGISGILKVDVIENGHLSILKAESNDKN